MPPAKEPVRRTVVCESCGGRFAVPAGPKREVVDCPACGYTQIVRPLGREEQLQAAAGEGARPSRVVRAVPEPRRPSWSESALAAAGLSPGRLERLRELHETFPAELVRRWLGLLACPVRLRVMDMALATLHDILDSYRLPNLRAVVREGVSGAALFWGWTSTGALAATRAHARATTLRAAWEAGIAKDFAPDADEPLLHERSLSADQEVRMRSVLAPLLEALDATWTRQVDTVFTLQELAWDKPLATQAAVAGEMMATLKLEILVQDVRSEAYLAYPPGFIERFLPDKRRE